MAKNKFIIFGLIGLNGVSILGNALSEFAIPWLILQMTGSPTYVGILLGFKFIPVFLSAIIGGGMIDRFGSVKTSQCSDLLNFIAVSLIPLLFVYDQLNMSLLAGLIFLSAVLDSPGRSAKDVIFATEIETGDLPREKMNGFNSLIESMMDLFGPLLAGILIGLYGLVNVLWFDAFSFLIPFIGLIMLQKYLVGKPDKNQESSLNFKQFLAGFDYIFRHKEMLIILILSAIVSMALSVLLFLYLPIFTNLILKSPVDQGIIMVFFATGTMSSTLLYTFLGGKFDYQNLLSFGYLGLGFGLVVINFAANLWTFAVILMIIGLFLGFSGPLEASYLQKQVAEDMRGRVFATYGGLRQLFVPISMPIVGYYLEFVAPMRIEGAQVYLPHVMLFMGLLLLSVVLIYIYQFQRKK